MPRALPALARLPLACAVLLAAGASPASAASLTLTAVDQVQPGPLTVRASGTVDGFNGEVHITGERNGTSCGATPGEHESGRTITYRTGGELPAGDFSVDFSQKDTPSGTYRFCAFLTEDRGQTIAATAHATARYAKPACESAAFSIVSAGPNGSNGRITVTRPGDGDFGVQAGDGGTTGLTRGPDIDVFPSSATQNERAAGRSVTVTYVVSFTRSASGGCTRPDGTETDFVTETRTASITYPPAPQQSPPTSGPPAPPCPSADFTIAGAANLAPDVDVKPHVDVRMAVDVPSAGSVTIQANDVGAQGGGPSFGHTTLQGPGRAIVPLSASADTYNALVGVRRPVTVTYTATFTPALAQGTSCTGPDGQRTFTAPSGTRTFTATLQPAPVVAKPVAYRVFTGTLVRLGAPARTGMLYARLLCVTAGTNQSCNAGQGARLAGKVSLTVTEAVRRRLRLPSRTVASGALKRVGGESSDSATVAMKATKATERRLKRVRSFRATLRVQVDAPLRQTITRTITASFKTGQALIIRGPGDSFVVNDRG